MDRKTGKIFIAKDGKFYKMRKILLLGGNGYIGSRFLHDYSTSYDITAVDIGWFSDIKDTYDFNNLDKAFIQDFESVILFAGHSSVKMCEGNRYSSFNNNVRNFVSLLDKLNNKQKLIYASSSSVYGNTDSTIVDETYKIYEPNNYYDLTKQVCDVYASMSGLNTYGLRFGTVNGWSPHLRADIMINSMVVSALQDGHVKLYVKDINRPILGLSDLTKAVNCIIESNKNYPGIYNLASFNSTSGEIAYKVGQEMKVPVIEYSDEKIEEVSNVKLQSKAYNFSIDTNKFESTFNFKFNETIESIVKEVKTCVENNECEITRRTYNVQYE